MVRQLAPQNTKLGLERKVHELYLATWVTTLYSKSIPSSSPSPLFFSSPLKALVGILGVGGMTNGRGPKVVKTSAVLVDLKRYRVSQKKWCIAISNSRVVLDDQRLIKLTDT